MEQRQYLDEWDKKEILRNLKKLEKYYIEERENGGSGAGFRVGDIVFMYADTKEITVKYLSSVYQFKFEKEIADEEIKNAFNEVRKALKKQMDE